MIPCSDVYKTRLENNGHVFHILNIMSVIKWDFNSTLCTFTRKIYENIKWLKSQKYGEILRIDTWSTIWYNFQILSY